MLKAVELEESLHESGQSGISKEVFVSTILIVDDTRASREMLVTLLNNEAHRLLEAADGAEALTLIRSEHPDLVISDILMPIMDGFELVRQVRTEPTIAATPVIFYTANYAEAEAQALADACRVFRVLAKPAPREIMLQAIEEAMGAHQSPQIALPPEPFNREHLSLLTDKLSAKVAELEHEIEERKQAEEALRATGDRLNGILDSIASGIFSVSATSTPPEPLFYNPAMARIYDCPVSEFFENPGLWLAMVHPDDLQVVRENVRQTLAMGSAEHEFRIVRPDGEIRSLHAQTRLAYDVAGRPERVDGILTDVTEQVQAQEQIRRRVEQLTALRAIDIAIRSSFDLQVTLNAVVHRVISLLSVDAADILLLDPFTQTLEYACGLGFRTTGVATTRLRLGEGLAGRVALECRLRHIPDLSDLQEPSIRPQIRGEEEFIGYCGVPLLAKEKVLGVLGVFQRSPLTPDAEWLELLQTLAGLAAIAIDNAMLFDDLQRSSADLIVAYDSTLEGWGKALDLRDKETEGHTQRVAELAVRLARAVGMRDEELAQVRRGALLHDIGKLGIPDNILLKPGPLTAEEWEVMRKHPVYAYEWLARIAYLRPALDIPYCHHEKWDGSGYPCGLRGEQIPLAARVFAVVDVWDALLSDRPYRLGWPIEKAREHIRSQAGVHFDPRVADLFLEIVAEPDEPQSTTT